jgi:hypothetical protein
MQCRRVQARFVGLEHEAICKSQDNQMQAGGVRTWESWELAKCQRDEKQPSKKETQGTDGNPIIISHRVHEGRACEANSRRKYI